MRAVRPAHLALPLLWGALGALLVGASVGRTHPLAGTLLAAAVWLGVAAFAGRRALARWRASRRPLPFASVAWLADHVPLYAAADADARRRFERDVQIALAVLRFEAAGGATVTDRLRLAVAAGAALLLHGRPDWDLPAERTILFVPDTFDDAYGDEEEGVYDGMVHPQGPVVLSVRATLDGWAHGDGHNVVLHELAHLFDMDGLGADGVPTFLDPRSAEAWGTLLRDEMRRARMGKSVLRSYAASAPAELFAVATEQFFERPARLRARHPELFDAMVAFYALTPPDEAAAEPTGSWAARRWEGGGA